MTIIYIPGEDNTVADTLSQIAAGAFPGETSSDTCSANIPGIHATLSITTDPSVLRSIQQGYEHDEFCKKIHLGLILYTRHIHLQWSMVHW